MRPDKLVAPASATGTVGITTLASNKPTPNPGARDPTFSWVREARTLCPISVASLTCVDGTRVVVGVGTSLLAAAHGGSRLLAARALLYTHPRIGSREGEMWRDRETLSKPSTEEENHNSTSSEGNAGVPDPLQPLLTSPRQHPSSRASAL